MGSPSNPRDPAAEIDRLPDVLGDLPDEDAATVAVDEDWTAVPGLPIEVREVDEAGEDPSETPTPTPSEEPSPTFPSDSSEPSPSTAAYLRASATEETPGASEAPTEEPTDEPSPTEPSPTDPSPTDPTEDPEGDADQVDVALDIPEAGARTGQMLLTFATSSDAGASAESESSTPPAGFMARSSLEPGAAEEPGALDGEVEVRFSYEDFAEAFGGAWFERLQVMAYPACFATSPDDPACATGVPVEFTVDSATEQLVFTTVDEAAVLEQQDVDGLIVDEPDTSSDRPTTSSRSGSTGSVSQVAVTALAAPTAGGVVYSVGGSGGNYAASPLAGSASWQVGTGSGEFSYSYPFELPKALGGATPDLSLDYSSGSVDGMSLSENGQATPAGLGWSLSTAYISRSFAACANDGYPAKGDLCWKTSSSYGLINDLSIVLNGKASRLVQVGSSNQYRLADDPGWKVELVTGDGPDNGAFREEKFRVTTPDGTKYWFGWYGSSTWTVPVFGNNAGEPCYSTPVSGASCKQAWRWNLDRSVDTHGNVVRYSYAQETNHYAKWGVSSTPVEYDRGGRLTKIEYGFRNDSDLAHQVVEVSAVKRCTKTLADPAYDCTGTESPRNKPSLWPDVPTDLICDQASCLVGSPTFFSLNRYHQVTTKTVQGTTAASATTRNVDVYTLSHSMPDPDGTGKDQPDLWLTRIDRTGYGDGSTTRDMPGLLLFSGGEPLRNRVVAGSGERTLKKYRVSAIRTEIGGRIDVEYGHASGGNRACDATYVQDLSRNASNRECFPQKYAPAGGTPRWEWFHKYVVTRVAMSDMALGYRYQDPASKATDLGQLRVYDYDYWGDPAWRFVRDNNVPNDDETWDDWRGYETTVISTRKTAGNDYQVVAGDISREKVTVFRGMNGARKNLAGEVKDNVRVTTEEHGSTNGPLDQPWYQGKVAESRLADGDGTMISRTYHDYDHFNTASDPSGPDGHIVYERMTRTTTRVAGSTANTVKETTYTADPGGQYSLGVLAGTITEAFTKGYTVGGSTELQSCTRTNWQGDGDRWLRVQKSNVTYSTGCNAVPSSEPELSRATLSKTHYCYDAQGAADCQGPLEFGDRKVVKTFSANGEAVTSKSTYDSFGRIESETVGEATTTYTYNPGGAAGDLLSKVAVVQSAEGAGTFTTSSTFDLRRGLPTTNVDANGKTTRLDYDPLGRLASVTYPGNNTGIPSIQYTYRVGPEMPSRVKIDTLGLNEQGANAVDSAYTFTDGWGRTVETQVLAPDIPDDAVNKNQRIVTVTGYDEQGLARYTVPALNNPNSAPNLAAFESVVNPSIPNSPRHTQTTYDAAGRPVAVQERTGAPNSDPTTIATTNTTYSGASITVDPRQVATRAPSSTPGDAPKSSGSTRVPSLPALSGSSMR